MLAAFFFIIKSNGQYVQEWDEALAANLAHLCEGGFNYRRVNDVCRTRKEGSA